ncbi:ATP-binding cassette domain-containing protein [Halorussus aquaticus]|uniref:ATP-binding cassette domain-containing protein n=1 Tax=Halorussus aquaticus TaxID=2953748 RepID=A0ABD5Q102_9EURY|nr:ATP-binding cassette domain-containing protein [Halorussus aquaticus]
MAEATLLEVRSLDAVADWFRVTYDVNLTVTEGEVVGILGPDGAGKTTVTKGILGYRKPRSGSVRLRGVELTEQSPEVRQGNGIGYQSDSEQLFDDLTVDENLRVPIWKRGDICGVTDGPDAVDHVYERFESLSTCKHKRIETFDDGDKTRKAAIGQSLVLQPDLLVLDEPLRGVSPDAADDICETLRELKTEGLGILLTDSGIDDPPDILDRAIVMERGEIIDEGGPDRVSSRVDEADLDRGWAEMNA